jgi:hypothetical protein
LLRYNLALDHLVFTATELPEGTVVDLDRIDDTQFGEFVPTLRDVRGVTFHVADSSRAEIRIRNQKLPETEIVRNPPDDAGRPSIGIRWFAPDYTDYTRRTDEECTRLVSD